MKQQLKVEVTRKVQLVNCTIFIAFLAGSGLMGCSEYMDRKDTIALNAGEAVATNIIAHVEDPWPSNARYKDIAFSGERIARATRRYQCGATSSSGEGSTDIPSVGNTPSSSQAGGC